MGIKEVLSEQLGKISLSSGQLKGLRNKAQEIISLLKNVGLNSYLGGSLAKGTILKKEGKQDIDIFVVFTYSEDISKFEEKLNSAKLPGPIKKIHGSRDYFQVEVDDLIFELIPVVKNKDPELAENVTDVSLRHVDYVKREIKKKKEIVGEILLAKSFCQAQKFYGAESYVRGFSGYSLEVLVIHYGSFANFLKGVGKEKVIDPIKHFKTKNEVMREINEAKIKGPLILVDPTYKYRNVCAGLGTETFEKFLKVAKEFMKKPSTEYFNKKEVDVEGIKGLAKEKQARFVELEFFTDRQEGDIAGAKMKKLFDFLVSELVRKKQKVLAKEFDYLGTGKNAKGYLVIKEVNEIEVRGPLKDMDEPANAFKKAKGSLAYVKGKYYYFKESVSFDKVLGIVKKVEGDIGASVKVK